ncbi:hypothetical protein NQT62_08195 [Limnobacter humi]|uniref:Uncharacterized protein n=1 Tax=Limnobacter humi TaxID=1778671 RepID=A0ABT1WJ17_9BURK|nr:hypothetical protein [Limnobacter humi]MCQ8896409.1 hypothetical protein [Limnobacter humi]
MSSHPIYLGYYNSPWPAEDAGPTRLQNWAGFGWLPNTRLNLTHRRSQLSTMVVLGDPGEVFLLTHTALRAKFGMPTTARVEQIDPLTLKTIRQSPRLPGGPMWPGGLAVLATGNILVVYGRHAHLLNRQLQVIAHRELMLNEPHNSFVVLDNGWIVTKNLSQTTNACLQVLHPDNLAPVCPPIQCLEPSIARLGATGNTVYVVGMQHLYRYILNQEAQGLSLDKDWIPDYMGNSRNSFGWDMVLDGHSAWLMDNGHHRYLYTMVGAGVSPTANRLVRVSLNDPQQVWRSEVSGLIGGSVTNPPLVSPLHRVVLAYDSANKVLKAWRFHVDTQTEPSLLWSKSGFACASHMVLMDRSGVVWINDYQWFTESVVALDLQSGQELARIKTPGHMQGVVFPCPGWNRDIYWVSMDQVCRVALG